MPECAGVVSAQYQRVALTRQMNAGFFIGAVGIIVAEGANGFVPRHFDIAALCLAVNGKVAIDIIQHKPGNAVRSAVGADAVVENTAQDTHRTRSVQASDMDAVLPAPQMAMQTRSRTIQTNRRPRPGAGWQRGSLAHVEQYFRQPDDADADQQKRPIIRQIAPERNVMPQIVEQEYDADDDQDQRPGNGSGSHDRGSSRALIRRCSRREAAGRGWI